MNTRETNIPSIYALILPVEIDVDEETKKGTDMWKLAERLIEEEKEKGERKTLIMGLGEFQDAINHEECFTDLLNESYVQFAIKLNDKEERK